MKERPCIFDPFKEDLERWFQEEKLTYDQALARLAEQGCSTSRSNLAKWWGRRMEELGRKELLLDIQSGSRACREMDAAFKDDPAPELKDLAGVFKVLTMNLAAKAKLDPELLKHAVQCMDRVVSATQTQFKERELGQKEAALALDREKFEFNAAGQCLKQLPTLKAIAADATLTGDEKIQAIRERLFGEIAEEVSPPKDAKNETAPDGLKPGLQTGADGLKPGLQTGADGLKPGLQT